MLREKKLQVKKDRKFGKVEAAVERAFDRRSRGLERASEPKPMP
ncbi:hypothetical protein [Thermus sp.]|nr:hypothetical protein [Thermus sp.]